MENYWNPDYLDINLIEGELDRNEISYNLDAHSLNNYLPGISANLLLGNDKEITEDEVDFYDATTTPEIKAEILKALNTLREMYTN